ncbi:MAG: hypothetical protein EXS02_13005 [Planctomycetes bacterium]|nr:hypothetical protein [Planctomycetota bacterium]
MIRYFALVLVFLLRALLSQDAQVLATSPSGIKDYGRRDYLRLSKPLPHQEDQPWRLVCTLPHNAHFQPWIEVESEAGKVIHFNSTNPLVLYLTPTETVTTGAGVQQHEARNWVSGEGASYLIPAGVIVRAVQYHETGYDTEFVGSFTCNDADYTVLWQKAARTAYLCMRDHFYDCPDRERVGFWGDGTPELNTCFYVFDAKSHRLCKELVLRPLEPKFYPGQHLEFLGSYGLWFYYLQTGDLDSLRKIYEPTRKFLFETYKTGNRGTWFDWGKEVKDTAVLENCFLFDCLSTLRKIAAVTGHEADFAVIDERCEAIRSTFDKKFWQGSYYMSPQVKEPDDRANAMAVNCGLADAAKWPAIYDNVLTKKTYSSCFFDRWVFEALCAMGKQEYALLRMAERYRTMIPCRFTTLWEHYDRWWASQIDAFDDASSLNHGWNPPALLLSQTVAGVSPEVPGWSTYHVLPKVAFLTSLQVVVPSIRGNVTVDIKKSADDFQITLDSPKGTTAIVGMPKISFEQLDSIQVNDVTVWDGQWRGGVSSVVWQGEDAEYVKLAVAGGTWRVRGCGRVIMTQPKPAPLPNVTGTPLDNRDWIATASVADSTFPFSGEKLPIDIAAANAIDGDPWTGFRDMTAVQRPGQWFAVDMQREQRFDRIVLDTTWALFDSPVSYRVQCSQDGKTWLLVATGKGQRGITTITFAPQVARHLRIEQTGTDATYHWSIYELDVFAAR